MFPIISNRQYQLDRIRHEKKCGLGMALIVLTLITTSAQAQPAPVDAALPRSAPVSVEYYQRRIMQTDLLAARLMAENAQLHEKVQALETQLKAVKGDKAPAPPVAVAP
jgi:hypothetical protein